MIAMIRDDSMKSSQGLFLDLDGTLADSLGVMRRVYSRFLARWSCPATDDEFDSLNGPPLPEVVRRLKQIHSLKEGDEDLLAIYRNLIVNGYDDVAPTSGAVALVEAAQQASWVVGVVTSNSKALTRRWLERANLFHLVDVLVCGDDVKVGKPEPEPYLLALQRGGCSANSSLAVEDSPQGAVSAIRAGVTTFGFQATGWVGNWPTGVRPISDLMDVLPYVTGDAHA